MRILNLNSHPIRVERPDGGIYEYPPDGRLLRLQTIDEIVEVIDGNPIIRKVYFEPEDQAIPDPEPGVWYIVPSQVCQILRRPDFISPDTKASYGARRDHKGQIMSVSRFRVCDILKARAKEVLPPQNGITSAPQYNAKEEEESWREWRKQHPRQWLS